MIPSAHAVKWLVGEFPVGRESVLPQRDLVVPRYRPDVGPALVVEFPLNWVRITTGDQQIADLLDDLEMDQMKIETVMLTRTQARST